jgi:hypothetical protein
LPADGRDIELDDPVASGRRALRGVTSAPEGERRSIRHAVLHGGQEPVAAENPWASG